MSYPTPEERRNLAFAFIRGRVSVTNPRYTESNFECADLDDLEAQLVLREFEEFLRDLPALVAADKNE
jgi:hypothetical protein